jgi:hypothetical protein
VLVTVLSGTGYSPGSPSNATVTIADDEPHVTIAATTPTGSEPSTAGVFTVTRTGSTASAVTVNYTVGGTALADSDYTALSGSVVISAGSSTATISVLTKDDNTAEVDETVIVTISDSSLYQADAPREATVIIQDNEARVFIEAVDADMAEPSNTGTFKITRVGSTSGSLVVNYSTGGTAVSGTDYTALSGSATIPNGSSTVIVTVSPANDSVAEPDDTLIITLEAGSGYVTQSPQSATLTIHDDEPNVTITTATSRRSRAPMDISR